MDRGALSDARVIEATRKFVCIRLATYEDAKEAKFLKSIIKNRSGELENTTFAVLSPDGKTKLSRSHRSADHVFGPAHRMESELNKIAAKYEQKTDVEEHFTLPFAKSVDVGINIASADQLPVLAMHWNDESEKSKLEETLRKVAWADGLIGQFVFVNTNEKSKLKPITRYSGDAGICLVEPGKFGLSGICLKHLTSDVSVEELEKAMSHVVATMPRPNKNHRNHVNQGISLGLEWTSEIPETDPMSIRARQRIRGDK